MLMVRLTRRREQVMHRSLNGKCEHYQPLEKRGYHS